MAIVLVVLIGGCADRVAPGPADASGPADARMDVPVTADSATDVAGEAPIDARADPPVDLPPDCGGCPAGKTCCASQYPLADRPRCVDLQLNPEHCGSCGHTCGPVRGCLDGQCTALEGCGLDGGVADADGGACPDRFTCSTGGNCCPGGTTYGAIPVSFVGCCPDTDICGCVGDLAPGDFMDCPVSRRAAKRDIRHLTPAEVDAARERLLAIRLAGHEYRRAPGPRHLGFIIDDLDEATARACVAPDGDHVDLYGYTSLAVAALQAQQRQLDHLRRELAELRRLVQRPRQ
jgi:hypothetical protein